MFDDLRYYNDTRCAVHEITVKYHINIIESRHKIRTVGWIFFVCKNVGHRALHTFCHLPSTGTERQIFLSKYTVTLLVKTYKIKYYIPCVDVSTITSIIYTYWTFARGLPSGRQPYGCWIGDKYTNEYGVPVAQLGFFQGGRGLRKTIENHYLIARYNIFNKL